MAKKRRQRPQCTHRNVPCISMHQKIPRSKFNYEWNARMYACEMQLTVIHKLIHFCFLASYCFLFCFCFCNIYSVLLFFSCLFNNIITTLEKKMNCVHRQTNGRRHIACFFFVSLLRAHKMCRIRLSLFMATSARERVSVCERRT